MDKIVEEDTYCCFRRVEETIDATAATELVTKPKMHN
jgi:hypothetical protein